MSAYRFCRSDDVPLLVRAYNECYRVHFPDLPEMTVDRFKRLIKIRNLWTSSCMVASAGDRLIGVLLAAKREAEGQNLIMHVGVHPEFQRQGHGRHLMTSLGSKLAILGPTRLVAEVGEEDDVGRAFVEACGYRHETTYTDFSVEGGAVEGAPEGLVIPVTLKDLLDNECFDREARRCWDRAPQTLLNLRDEVQGLAIATADRIEASLLYADDAPAGQTEILALECPDGDRRAIWLDALLRSLIARCDGRLRVAGVGEQESLAEILQARSFHAGARTLAYAAEAQAA
ncbi:MAG: GNAT family N-acetyltransferase [bacterium]|nr:GNAT family N-acetyltransferase [bacterium]